ncbi:ABC transporter substrate-binding protein [Actinomyces faecalis]|uniref:ABC transporter substrate-binding protein n=1 Tax=Actinomyces faecalis TaxID=2722820 RepID=UPI0015567864|nr:extracellular solute-binding protein [Actinomyces faecalis]
MSHPTTSSSSLIPGSFSRRRLLMGSSALAAMGLLAACTPSGSSSSSSAAPVDVSTDISGVGDVTLTVWDQEVRGGQNEQMERLNKAFMDTYPNVTIKRVSQSFDDLQTTLRLALSGDDAPDVVEANNSRSTMGAFVAAGQLISLDPWISAYGWDKSYSASILSYSSYSADGKTFGSGSLWGLPQVGEAVGIYYVPSRLAELGLEPPSSWEELTEQLATIKAAGKVPLMLGNVEKWPALHVFGPVQGAHVPADDVRSLGFGNAGASWKTEENLAAATQVQEWAAKGYFNEGFNGVDYDTVWQDFSTGTGTYLIAGSWLAPDLKAVLGDDVAFMLPPASKAIGKPATTGGTGLPFAITSAARNPNVAAAYIDFITNADAMKVLADTGNVPINDTASFAADAGGVVGEVMTAFQDLTTSGEVLPYLDYATPTFDQVLGDALQQLLDGQTEPEAFLDTLEAAYTEFTAS